MARYVDTLLADGEEVVYRTRQHPFARLADSTIGIASVGLALAGLIIWLLGWFKAVGWLNTLLGWATLVFFVIGAAWVTRVYLFWQSQDYVVTTRRVLKAEGIVNKTSADSSLEKINDAILHQGFLGRIFDWGDLRILTASDEVADDYRMLHHAPTFKKTMLNQKHALEQSFYPAPTPPISAPAPAAPPAVPAPVPVAAVPALPGPAEIAAAESSATADRLRELAKLRDEGLLSGEEFEAKKQELIGRL